MTQFFHSLSRWLLAVFLLVALAACQPTQPQTAHPSVEPANAEATPATRALLANLHDIKNQGFLFGHQDTTAYGVQWENQPDQSDVKRVTGDFPALYGWDVGHLERGDDSNLDGVSFQRMRQWMLEAFERGGVVTVSWHMTHPGTGADSWNTDTGAASLLPGGEDHRALKASLDRFAAFVRSLEVDLPEGGRGPMPLIFRPWHEHNGDWFWWAKGATAEQDYIELWRFTVDYLTQTQGLDNLLFAFSPDRSRLALDDFETAYLYGYPGDGYVDILGIDNYWDLGHGSNEAPKAENLKQFVASLTELAKLAAERHKLPAVTEGGQDTLFEADFFTERLLSGLLANEWTRQMAYVQLWRNANRARENKEHFYVPYPGHPAEADFLEFYDHPATLFESDLPALYRHAQD
ncbi:glycoside hydrolase family 26 protein [Marinimicrobium locisalis]|uniref:glycoside hydrolase family 26 protein n=1 Tax=Marinimicrobium locisalis TaxID=546022 RepID=UPI0032218BFB